MCKSAPDYGPLAEANRYAADKAYEAAMASIKYLEEAEGRARDDVRPWKQAGLEALSKYQSGMRRGIFDAGEFVAEDYRPEEYRPGEYVSPEFEAPTAADMQADPGYAFTRQEGEKALNRQLAAGGMSFGGAAAKALLRYNQGLASTQYDKVYGRALTQHGLKRDAARFRRGLGAREHAMREGERFRGHQLRHATRLDAHNLKQAQLDRRAGRLAALAGVGHQTATGTANRGMSTAAQIGSNLRYGAEAQGSGAIGAANAGIQQTLAENQASAQNWGTLFGGISAVAGLRSAWKPWG